VEPEVDDIYADHDDDDDDGFGGDSDDEGVGAEKKGKGKEKKAPPDPDTHLRVWMPACMVKLVEPGLVEEFEEVVRRREEKKAGRGKGRKKRTTKKTLAWFDEPSDEDVEAKKSRSKSKAKTAAATKKTKATAYIDVSEEDSMDSDNVRKNLKGYFTVPKPKPPTLATTASEPSGSPPKVRSKPPPIPHKPLYDSSSDSSSSESMTLSAPIPPTKTQSKAKSSPAIIRISDILSPPKPSSPLEHKRSPSPGPTRMEPKPFPMALEDDFDDFVDNDFDFAFDLGNMNEDEGMHMNDDPFLDVDGDQEPPMSPTPSPPKQGRKKLAQSSSESGAESREAPIKKSPRKSKKQTSPRHSSTSSDHRNLDSELEDAVRPGSPSPMRPRPKAPVSKITSKQMPKTIAKKPYPSKADGTIIDISSGEDALPPPKLMKPLLVARSKKTRSYMDTTKISKPVVKVRAQSALAISDMNSQPTYDDDIIDLT
jgi:Holliday junction resolvase YEN1